MIPGDEILFSCNESELLWIARIQGHPILRRGIPRDELVGILVGDVRVQSHHMSGTIFSRASLEDGIRAKWNSLMGQLPGCTGQCRTFLCTEERHMDCFVKNARYLT
jgi:hypothetical protein